MDKYPVSPMTTFHYPINTNFKLDSSVSYFLKDDDGYIKLGEKNEIQTSVNKKDVLDLTGDQEKVIIQINHYLFGFLFQEIPEVLAFYSRIKNRKIKAYINIVNPIASEDFSLSSFIIKYLKDLNVEVELINNKNFKELKINNFYVLAGDFDPIYIKLLYSKIKKYIKNIKNNPFRKVFVARKKHFQQRIDSDKSLKDFFASVGFEIVYAEDFKNLFDQINYFSECKVLAGISGSGLSNCIFMKPGGALIEISSFFDINDNGVDVEIHHFYKMMADSKDHLYLSMPNLSGKSQNFINNKKALSIIEML